MFLTPHGWHLLHHMMTSSNGSIFRVTGPLCGEFTGLGEFHTQRPVTRSFGVFFDLRLNKRLSKQPWGWWFETPPWSLWRHCNERLALEISYSYATHATVTVTLQRRLVCKCHIEENVFVVLRYIYIYSHILMISPDMQIPYFSIRLISRTISYLNLLPLYSPFCLFTYSWFLQTKTSHRRYWDSNHRQLDWLIHILFRLTHKKPHHYWSVVRGSSVTGGFPTQINNTAESVPMWWRYLFLHQPTSTQLTSPWPFANNTPICVRFQSAKRRDQGFEWDCFQWK